MNRLFVCLPITLFCLLGCTNTISLDPICLNEWTTEENDQPCTSEDIYIDCERMHLGTLSLSESSKNSFVDFCSMINEEIPFRNSINTNLLASVVFKEFKNDRYSITRLSEPCINYCLDNEVASMGIRSERFDLEMSLYSGIENHTEGTKNIAVSIFARKGNAQQVIFTLTLEDENYLPVVSDTIRVRYHDEIFLNNQVFTNIYSNENNFGTGLKRNEKVYFSKTKGLIAVRDSLGILWLKDI